MSDARSRRPPSGPSRKNTGGVPDGLLLGGLGLLLGLALLTWTATGLAGLLAHGSWPRGAGIGGTAGALRSLISAPHDLPAAWPGTPAGQLPGYGLFWGVFISQVLVLVVLTVFALGTTMRARAVRADRKRKASAAVDEAGTGGRSGTGRGPGSAADDGSGSGAGPGRSGSGDGSGTHPDSDAGPGLPDTDGPGSGTGRGRSAGAGAGPGAGDGTGLGPSGRGNGQGRGGPGAGHGLGAGAHDGAGLGPSGPGDGTGLGGPGAGHGLGSGMGANSGAELGGSGLGAGSGRGPGPHAGSALGGAAAGAVAAGPARWSAGRGRRPESGVEEPLDLTAEPRPQVPLREGDSGAESPSGGPAAPGHAADGPWGSSAGRATGGTGITGAATDGAAGVPGAGSAAWGAASGAEAVPGTGAARGGTSATPPGAGPVDGGPAHVASWPSAAAGAAAGPGASAAGRGAADGPSAVDDPVAAWSAATARAAGTADARSRILGTSGPAVVVSRDPRLWEVTKDARSELGPVHVFDPTQLCDTTARLRWSPHHGCAASPVAAARARDLLAPLRTARPAPGDAETHTTAETLLRCWLHAAALARKPFRDVHRWAQSGTSADPVHTLRTHSRALSGAAGELEAVLIGHPERRRGATELVQQALAPMGRLHVRHACSSSRADRVALDSLATETGTLYIVGDDPSVLPLLHALTRSVTTPPTNPRTPAVTEINTLDGQGW